MRLICPNCGAQYEVDASMIPVLGRDVQCSSCGNTWFQPGDQAAAPPEAEAGPDGRPGTGSRGPADSRDGQADADRPAPDRPAPDRPEADRSVTAARDADDTSGAGSGDDADAAADPADIRTPGPVHEAMRRRELDDTTRSILREEAEREAKARRGETEPLESQPDLGLTESAPRRTRPAADSRPGDGASGNADAPRPDAGRPSPPDSDPVPPAPATPEPAGPATVEPGVPVAADPQQRGPERARVAAASTGALAGKGPLSPTAESDSAASRRDLLPDIEEINSTLTATSDRTPETADVHEARGVGTRRGFRLGFSLVVLVTAALILIYVLAPAIADSMPGLEPQLAAYVTAVNDFRVTLDDWLQGLNAAISGVGATG